MYYELYIDVFFLTNFMMNSLLLMSVKIIMRYTASYRRILGAAALGSLLTCIAVLLPVPGAVKIFVVHAAVGPVMLTTAFGNFLCAEKIAEFLKTWGCLYVTAFLFGGVLQAFRPYIRTGSIFFAAAAATYYLVTACWKFLSYLRKAERNICEADLYTSAGRYRVRALVDTGNGLTDPISAEPVSIIDRHTAGEIFAENTGEEKIRYIPYRSVGAEGLLPILRIEKMCIYLKEEHWIAKPLIGICEESVSRHETYQMILNPDIVGGTEYGCKSSSSTAVQAEDHT